MSEQTDTANAGEQDENDGKGFEPITSQEELDRIITGRLDRERKKFADYDDLKAKASELDAIREASKTEDQKRADALKAKEAELATALSEAALAKAALKHGLSADDMELIAGGTPEEIEAKAAKLAERLKSSDGTLPVVRNADKTPNKPAKTGATEVVNQLFGTN